MPARSWAEPGVGHSLEHAVQAFVLRALSVCPSVSKVQALRCRVGDWGVLGRLGHSGPLTPLETPNLKPDPNPYTDSYNLTCDAKPPVDAILLL